MILTMLFLIFLMFFKYESGMEYMMLDIGQGSCNLIKTQNTVIVVDCGSTDVKDVARYRVIPCLNSKGIGRIDYAIVTHSDADHISGFEEIIKEGRNCGLIIKKLVLPHIRHPDENYRRLEKLAKNSGVKVMYMERGNVISSGRLKLKCLHPSEDFEWNDVNEYSIVLDLRYGNFSALLTGDVTGNGEDEVEKCINSEYTILEVAHHGSRFSTEESFLKRVRPKYSLISCGVNNSYGHPHKETIDRLEKYGTKINVTAGGGAIDVKTDGRRICTLSMPFFSRLK